MSLAELPNPCEICGDHVYIKLTSFGNRHLCCIPCDGCNAEVQEARRYRLLTDPESPIKVPWDCECMEHVPQKYHETMMKNNMPMLLKALRHGSMIHLPELLDLIRKWGRCIDDEGVDALDAELMYRKKGSWNSMPWHTNYLQDMQSFRPMCVSIKKGI